MNTIFDTIGVKNAILSKERPKLREFYEKIVEKISLKNHLTMTDFVKRKVVDTIIEQGGVSLRTGELENAVIKIFKTVAKEGNLAEYIQTFIDKGEIEKTRFTSAIIKGMIQFLLDRGILFSGAPDAVKANITAGMYDEQFFAAYNHAILSASDELDPLDNTKGSQTSDPQLWDFTIRTFDQLEDKGVIPTNILAAGAVDYVYELGERLGVFRLVDAMVLNWSSGVIDVVDGSAAGKLYAYWKKRDDRCDPEERGMLYRRILDKGETEVLSRMVINEHFPKLWSNLMTEVVEYIDKTERLEVGSSESSPVSRRGVFQATKELQYNLTEFCTGMAHMKVREIYAQLMDAFDILDDPDILSHFGGSRRKSLWTVIEQLSKTEFNMAPNVAAHRTLAVEGNRIFQWIANFNEGAVNHDQFLEFLNSAESYILSAAAVENGGELIADEEEEADDFEGGDMNDQWDDF
jgi:hypothetical protein